MSQTQTNKDLPASPLMFKTQFGQEVILAGFTKQEVAALSIIKSQLSINYLSEHDPFDIDKLIENSFVIAEKFCQYLEKTIEPESQIKLM